jgi:hypothetical protein
MMKRKMFHWIIVLALVLLPLSMALAGISGSRHDFGSITGGGTFISTNEPEICIFCHTPHSAVSQDASGNSVPLWNRSLNDGVATYQMYWSPTLHATMPGSPSGMSLLCMSCHDGISAINVLVNHGSVNPITMQGGQDQLGDIWSDPAQPGYPGGNVGELLPGAPMTAQRNLSNDHPISFTYDSTLAATPGIALNDPGVNGANIAPLKLFTYGARVNVLECSTCHDPHEEGSTADNTYPFLRMSNFGSEMCLACHAK